MTVTPGAISLVSKTDTTVSLSATEASGGTSPYTKQWYMSTVTGFSPGVGNEIDGATALTLSVTGLLPGTTYYFKVVYTDDAATPETGTATQLAVSTDSQVQNPNQFTQAPYLGMSDLRFNSTNFEAEVDLSQSQALVNAQAVKMVDSAGGVPKVVACSADTDAVWGFILFNMKNRSYSAGAPVTIASGPGSVIYLIATAAIARGAEVVVATATIGGVTAASGSGGERIVGYALDKASASGQLIRVMLHQYKGKLDA